MRLEWTRRLTTAPVRLHLAREAWRIVVHEPHALSLWDGRGEREISRSHSGLRLVHGSDTADLFLAVDDHNRLLGFNADLEPLWQLGWESPIRAIAVAPLGQQLAVADERGVSVLDETGQPIWRGATPRPFHHLAWIPEGCGLVGAADFGFVCGFDRTGTVRWREGLMTNIGSLALSGDGTECLLACFSDGIRIHRSDRVGCPPLAVSPATGTSPCRSLSASYDAGVVISLDLEGHRLERLERGNGSRRTLIRETPITTFATDATGQVVIVGTAAGELSLWVAF